MKIHSPFANPCDCGCHDGQNVQCVSCCKYRSIPRADAEKEVHEVRAQYLAGDRVQSVLEIKGHEHNVVALSNLTEGNHIKTLLILIEPTPDAGQKTTKDFLPASRTVLECCASVEVMHDLMEQSEEFRSIATVQDYWYEKYFPAALV